MTCEAKHCKSKDVSYTCGGYFCSEHKATLLKWHKILGMAKAHGDIFLEYHCRRVMKSIRTFDRGHYHRFLCVQQAVREALIFKSDCGTNKATVETQRYAIAT